MATRQPAQPDQPVEGDDDLEELNRRIAEEAAKATTAEALADKDKPAT